MPVTNYVEIVKDAIKALKKKKKRELKKQNKTQFLADLKALDEAYESALNAAEADPLLIDQAVIALKACEVKRDEYNSIDFDSEQ